MDVFQLEEKRKEILAELATEKFPLSKLQILNSFVKLFSSSQNKVIIEAFLSELIPHYYETLRLFNPIGINPVLLKNEINYLDQIISLTSSSEIVDNLKNEIIRIKKLNELIKNSLNGKINEVTEPKLNFPVNIRSTHSNKRYGQIESFSIKIIKDLTLRENKFIIIPSREKIDTRLEEQIKISWDIAIHNLSQFYKNFNKFHEVVIIFDHKFADVEGYSLGMAITLGFISELFKLYNTSRTLTLNGNVTFTGGVNKRGRIIDLGKDIIESKTETIFFSDLSYFALPENDYQYAKDKLTQLNIEYPERKLKLIHIEEFDDLLDHRQVIKIEKAKITERSKKLFRNQKLTLALSALLVILIGTISIYSIDNNPTEFQMVGGSLNVLNKRGKLLWSKPIGQIVKERLDDPKYFQRIYDIDNDGNNEVILSHENLPQKDMENHGRIVCFDSNGEILWKYKFKDTVHTIKNIYKDLYITRIVDIVKYERRTLLFCNARHTYFPSAVFPLDIRTGKRIDGLLWSQGHFNAGNIGDFDEDGNLELFIGGINNGYEAAFACIINLDELYGQTPTTSDYIFKDIKIANFKKYFLFPKTDMCIYAGKRFNGTELTNFYEDTKTYQIGVNEKFKNKGIGPYYVFNHNLDSAHLQIGDAQQFTRDSLVIAGKIPPPLTRDPEYEKILISNIKEWNGKEFVPFMNIK